MAQQLPKILHESRFADATPAASTTAAGFSVLHVRDWRPYTWWKPTTMPATITVDCGSAKAADYAALYAHDCASRGNTVEVRGSTDNFSSSNVLVASITPTADKPIVLTFNAVSYRYWRLRFTGGSAPTIAIAAIGTALTLPRYLREHDPIARQVRGQANRSEDGHPLGRVVVYEQWEGAIAVHNVSWSYVRDTFLPAWQAHLRSTPFLLAWDAGDHPTETRLLAAGGQLATPHRPGALADLIFDAVGVA